MKDAWTAKNRFLAYILATTLVLIAAPGNSSELPNGKPFKGNGNHYGAHKGHQGGGPKSPAPNASATVNNTLAPKNFASQSQNTTVNVTSPPGRLSDAGINQEIVIEGDSGWGDYRPVPMAYAPSLTSGSITCLGSASAGGSGASFGFSVGSTIEDPNCEAREDAKLLFNLGMNEAGVKRLCMRPDLNYALGKELCAGVEIDPAPGRSRAVAQYGSTYDIHDQ